MRRSATNCTTHRGGLAGAVVSLSLLGVLFSPVAFGAQSITRWIPLPVAKQTALADDVSPADPLRGAKLYAQCSACHEANSAAHKVGPSLAGIVGRPAAAFPDYAYSAALAGARREGLVWSPEFIDSLIAGPTRFLAGTKMPFIGIADAKDRRDLVSYLETLPPPQTASWLRTDETRGPSDARPGGTN
ncbi:MAG: c-type cytochrome [Hyphomicrobiaceae bacterium]|nr:c-type cytochrome [Hyphomicrobiaceae bacterium]